MKNKYIYSFLKDAAFRFWCCAASVGMIVVIIFLRIGITDGLALKDIQRKQVLIAQIPSLRARLADTRVVNGLLLSGIISGKEKPMAVVNGQLVSVGDEIEGKKVVGITDRGVTVCDLVAVTKCIELGL